ncbi:MAG: hypothetical protein ACKOPS_09695 [Cyanobium sp.]
MRSPTLRRTAPLAIAALAGSLMSTALVRADQPNMQNALSQLQAAKASLQAASHNKGALGSMPST